MIPTYTTNKPVMAFVDGKMQVVATGDILPFPAMYVGDPVEKLKFSNRYNRHPRG